MSRPHATEGVFTAISHPIRRKILDLLRTNDLTVLDIAKHFNASLSTVSQHLQILRHTGLVSQRRRKHERVYSLRSARLHIVATWLAPYRTAGTARNSS
jgi:DNA-binding transcriptional ArsR family regulator